MFYDNYSHNYADYIINLLYRISQFNEIYFVILKEYRVKIKLFCSTHDYDDTHDLCLF